MKTSHSLERSLANTRRRADLLRGYADHAFYGRFFRAKKAASAAAGLEGAVFRRPPDRCLPSRRAADIDAASLKAAPFV
jgi:hypothetical protein